MPFNSLFAKQPLSGYAVLTITLLAMTPFSSVFAADISEISTEIEKCSKTHDYDPNQASQLGPNELGKNERAFLECVYTSISEVLIPRAMVPDNYKKLIANDRKMTDAIEKGEMTRQQRQARIEQMLGTIRSSEAAVTEQRTQDLTNKRDQFLRERERMLKRNRRMF